MIRFPAGSSTSPERSDRLWDPLMPTHPLIHWVPGVKRQWLEADHWSPSSTRIGTRVPVYPLLHVTSLHAQELLHLLPFIGELAVWTGVTGKNVVPRQKYNSGHLVSCLIFWDYLRSGHCVNTEVWRLNTLLFHSVCTASSSPARATLFSEIFYLGISSFPF
jgi:hypothetical protein